jgi:hypothetical protein
LYSKCDYKCITFGEVFGHSHKINKMKLLWVSAQWNIYLMTMRGLLGQESKPSMNEVDGGRNYVLKKK